MSNMPLIASPARTQAIINRYGLNVKKSLGQNFLTDINILEHIVQAADLSPKDNVIEIGPGIGALTEFLAKNSHHVLAFEIDDQLVPVLDETLSQYDNITILNQDILKANLPQVVKTNFDADRPLKLVANLPYYITTPILMNVLQSGLHFDAITVMMQKEVADRLVAVPGTKAYGSLSIAVQYQTDCRVAFDVPRTAFIPQPNVDSAIITMTKREPFDPAPFDERVFSKFVKGSFLHRRKSFWNNLLAIFGKDQDVKDRLTNVLNRVRISPQIRAEKLTIEQFIELVNALHAEGLL